MRKLSGVSAQYIRIPPKCFRCALKGIQPSILNAPNGIWPKEATELFRKLTADEVEVEVKQCRPRNRKKIHLTSVFSSFQIYSAFDSIARVTIRTQAKVNINDLMVEKRYAERCEENYMSKVNAESDDSFVQTKIDLQMTDRY